MQLPKGGARVTGMTNQKCNGMVGLMCAFGSEFNSGAIVWLVCLALHQEMVRETLMRVQG